MRLLHVETKQFAEFFDQIPPYAILSHTWGSNELSFKDMERNEYTASLKTEGCCKQALEDGLEYVWIDTFCIDKSSSAELSEAINSMWAWYQRAEVCYAYLSDVPPETAIYEDDSAFCKSRWFTRGWTLQELLAPSKVVFYDESWGCIGRKTSASFTRLLAGVTRIPFDTLFFKGELHKNSVAQKMSWVSHRATTRVEDTAYSLLGLFGIHMPLLYGEGTQAFKRLQEEIIKVSDDESIFAWGFQRPPGQHTSLLSSSPLDFENCGFIEASAPAVGLLSAHYSLTNKGLHIKTSFCRLPMEGGTMALARLNCSEPKWREDGKSLALVLNGSPENHRVLSRRCEAAPLLVPSKLFRRSGIAHVYVRGSDPSRWFDEAFSGIKIQFSLFGDKAIYNIPELYPPAWRGILSSAPIIWYESSRLVSNHQNILFLVNDADRSNYVVWVDYTFQPNVRNLSPRGLKCRAAFIKEGMTLAEIMIYKKDVIDTALDWQEVLDFGDADLRMQLSKESELGFDVCIVHLDISNKEKLLEREKVAGLPLRKSYGRSALSRLMGNEGAI
ncbi:hypothetical protein V502_11466 [Pseudogymnoascus sp. VKM F-4520 (FW-2644)]|nr:hypothetical protein V502_11466 [Pseudogymnoascus sp. VKM F-4520 (FW-2644)]